MCVSRYLDWQFKVCSLTEGQVCACVYVCVCMCVCVCVCISDKKPSPKGNYCLTRVHLWLSMCSVISEPAHVALSHTHTRTCRNITTHSEHTHTIKSYARVWMSHTNICQPIGSSNWIMYTLINIWCVYGLIAYVVCVTCRSQRTGPHAHQHTQMRGSVASLAAHTHSARSCFIQRLGVLKCCKQ